MCVLASPVVDQGTHQFLGLALEDLGPCGKILAAFSFPKNCAACLASDTSFNCGPDLMRASITGDIVNLHVWQTFGWVPKVHTSP